MQVGRSSKGHDREFIRKEDERAGRNPRGRFFSKPGIQGFFAPSTALRVRNTEKIETI
jgi:hypothetical protein